MIKSRSDIIAQLRKEILPLEGYRPSLKNIELDNKIGAIRRSFPDYTFPLGAIHEFISVMPEDAAATGGFISAILASLMQNSGAAVWVGTTKNIFLPALHLFGVAPDRIIFIDLKKEKEILWVMEEALKCKGLSAVVGQVQELNFTASRRLQLAVEESKVTGFILRQNPRQINTTACVTRWKITSLLSETEEGMPGIGFPRWDIQLLKVRNGQPGNWQVEFLKGKFRHLHETPLITQLQKKRAV